MCSGRLSATEAFGKCSGMSGFRHVSTWGRLTGAECGELQTATLDRTESSLWSLYLLPRSPALFLWPCRPNWTQMKLKLDDKRKRNGTGCYVPEPSAEHFRLAVSLYCYLCSRRCSCRGWTVAVARAAGVRTFVAIPKQRDTRQLNREPARLQFQNCFASHPCCSSREAL